MSSICYKCGGLIAIPGVVYGWGGTFCHCCGIEPYFNPNGCSPYPPKPCEHCYCQEERYPLHSGKLHKKCCMCGNRKLK